MPITIDTLLFGLFVIALLFLVGGLLRGGDSSKKDKGESTSRGSRIRARAGTHLREMNAPSQAIFAGPGFSPGPLGGGPTSYAPPDENQRLPMEWDDVDPDIRRSLERKVAALPALPTLTTSLVAMLQDPDTEPKEIAKVAATDPAIATEIIRAINSAYFALREPCNDLDRSILLLGYNWVKFLVIRMSMTKSNKDDPAYEARLSGVWRHSFMTSECVTSIIRNYTRLQGAEASTAALLHDLGRLVELEVPGSEAGMNSQVMMDSAGIPVDERVYVEQDLFGVNHCLVGGLVAEHLSLTHLVRAVQLYHHHPVNAIWNLPLKGEVIQIIAAVKLADMMVHAFEDQQNPQPKIMTGLMTQEPDIAAFRPFFPNLPDFAVLMGFLEPEIQKSQSFLAAFLPKPIPVPNYQPQRAQPSQGVQVRYSDNPPQYGSSQIGDLVYNNNQSQGGPMGWVCVEPGEPGSWRPFGAPTTSQETRPVAQEEESLPPLGDAQAVPTPNPSLMGSPKLRLVREEQGAATQSPVTSPPREGVESIPEASGLVEPEARSTEAHVPSPERDEEGMFPAPLSDISSEPEPMSSPEPPIAQTPQKAGADSGDPEAEKAPEITKEIGDYRILFEDYLQAKAAIGADTSEIDYGSFAVTMTQQEQSQRLAADSKVQFRVLIREGRVVVVGRRISNT